MAPGKEKDTASEKRLSFQVQGMDVPQDHISFEENGYGTRHFVRNSESYKEVTNPIAKPVRVHRDRIYTIRDAGSFIAYIKEHGDHKKGIIFCENEKLIMCFDEANREERVVLPLQASLEVLTFLGKNGGKEFSQKGLLQALELFPEVIGESHKFLLPNIERLKLESTIEFESSLDDRDHVFMYKEKEGSQTARIPKQLTLTMPYFERSKIEVTIVVDLEIQKPKSADEKPVFILRNPKYERTLRDAVEAEIERIKAELKGWMFIWGEENGGAPRITPRSY